MRVPKAHSALAIPVRRALKRLGLDISAARRRRRITAALLAERAFTTRPTLRRIEKGDPGVSIGIYASVLFALGMVDRFAAIFDADSVGQALADDMLPKRVRPPKSAFL